MGLGMKKHPDKSRRPPVIGWMKPILKERQSRIHQLQNQLRAGAIRLVRTNAKNIADHCTNLIQAIRHGSWAQAMVLCATLLRLIPIQIEAERILNRSNGGRQ